MKKLFKYAPALMLTGALSLGMVLNADAQRGSAHAGGGGGRVSAGGFRGGTGYGGGYRGGLGFGLGFGYRGGYGYFGYPSLGFYLDALPFGYYPFYMGSSLYYYSDGIFYQPYNDGYAVTAPPVGAAVPKLPKGSKAIMIDNQQFFEFNGVYYKILVNDKGDKVYVVAGKDGVLNTDNGSGTNDDGTVNQVPKVGDVVDHLPENVHRVTLNGKKYYVTAEDIYFEEITGRNGNVEYRIASVPDMQ